MMHDDGDSGRLEETSDDQDPAQDQSTKRPTVVGIGASAGGLQPLRKFFENIPANTGMSFVVVVHLSPEHESSLAELIQKVCAIPVTQVSGTVHIEPDQVYVIPPNKNIRITNESLSLTDFEQPHGRRSSTSSSGRWRRSIPTAWRSFSPEAVRTAR